MAKKKRYTFNGTENKMVRSLDDLAEFEDYAASVLPKLRKMRRQGMTAKQIYEAFKDDFAARKVSIALDPNIAPEKALQAMDSLESRIVGKPTEKKNIEHKYSNVPDAQLDAILISEFDDLNSKGEEDDKGKKPEGGIQ